jgi:hypothetical protein
MRVQVLHDLEGTICGAFAPEEGRKGGLIARDPDRTVIEIDAPELAADSRTEYGNQVSATLAHLVENYRVDSGRLVERTNASG